MGQAIALAAIWGVLVVVMVARSWRGAPAAARKERAALARRVGMPAAGPWEEDVQSRFVSRRRGQMLGMAVGLVPTAVATSLMPLQDDRAGSGGWWVIAVPVGASVGAALGTLRATPRVPTGPRSASLTPRRVGDYLPAPERWATVLCLVPMAVALVVSVVFLVAGEQSVFCWLSLGATVVSLAVWAWTAHLGQQLLDQPAPASDPQQLTWYEAVRALALRDVWTVRSSVALFGGSLPAFALVVDGGRLRDPDGPVGTLVMGLGIGLLVLGGGLTLVLVISQLADQRLEWFQDHAGKGITA